MKNPLKKLGGAKSFADLERIHSNPETLLEALESVEHENLKRKMHQLFDDHIGWRANPHLNPKYDNDYEM